jgi:hypothetical protein
MADQDSAEPAPTPTIPTFTADVDTMSRKRPHHEVSSPTFPFIANKSMRPSPAGTPPRPTTRPVSPGSDSSLEILEQAFAQQNGSWQFEQGSSEPRLTAIMNQQREAEAQAHQRDAQRREQLERDRRMAASLSSNTFSRVPNGSSQQSVFNRDGTIRRPTPQVQFNSEQSSNFSNPFSKSQLSMNGSSSFSTQPNQYGVKKEVQSFKTEQPQSSSWTARGNPVVSIDSDSEGSDLEEIDATQFAQSSRSRQTSMQNANTQIYQHHLNPNIYSNKGHNQALSHQQSMINNGTQTLLAGDNGSFNSYLNGMSQQAIPTNPNTEDSQSRYWTDLFPSTNSFTGGFLDSFATLPNMVGFGNAYGSNKFSQSSRSMPGFHGGFNGYGTIGSSRNMPVINLDDDDDDEEEAPSTAFNYLYSDSSKTTDEIKALIENIAAGGEVPPEMRGNAPEAMAGPLFEHQKIGLKWLKEKYVF